MNALGVTILTVLGERFRWMTAGEIRQIIGGDDAADITAELDRLAAAGQVERQQLVPHGKARWGIRGARQ